MILTTENYNVQQFKNRKDSFQARLLLSAKTREALGPESRVLNVIFLEEGERPTAEELNTKLDKLDEVNDLYKKIFEMKEDLKQ